MKRPCVPFILSKGFSPGAFAFLKAQGVMAWTTKNIYGKDLEKSVKAFFEASQKIQKNVELDFHLFEQALAGFEKFGGIFGNLKGQLFEMLTAYYFSRMGIEGMKLGHIVEDEEARPPQSYDIDIMGRLGAEAIVVECKGLAENVALDPVEVRKHLLSAFLRQENS